MTKVSIKADIILHKWEPKFAVNTNNNWKAFIIWRWNTHMDRLNPSTENPFYALCADTENPTYLTCAV
jgi:hypothetical protein